MRSGGGGGLLGLGSCHTIAIGNYDDGEEIWNFYLY